MKRPHNFRGMKGERLDDLSKLKGRYPFFASYKLDGIRGFTFEPEQYYLDEPRIELISLTCERIPNRHIQKTMQAYGFLGLDGEILTYTNGKLDPYNTLQSKVMKQDGQPEFLFHWFDMPIEDMSYVDRMKRIMAIRIPDECAIIKWLPVLIETEVQLQAFEEQALTLGYEGVIIRSIDGLYKFGRSTVRQGDMLKLKRFLDAEATVIGFEELYHNQNDATINANGLMERSDHKAGKSGGNTLGALICVNSERIRFRIGTGLDDETRAEVWANRKKYLHRLVKYKYQAHGMKEAPRSPVFLGFRPEFDFTGSMAIKEKELL